MCFQFLLNHSYWVTPHWKTIHSTWLSKHNLFIQRLLIVIAPQPERRDFVLKPTCATLLRSESTQPTLYFCDGVLYISSRCSFHRRWLLTVFEFGTWTSNFCTDFTDVVIFQTTQQTDKTWTVKTLPPHHWTCMYAAMTQATNPSEVGAHMCSAPDALILHVLNCRWQGTSWARQLTISGFAPLVETPNLHAAFKP